VYSWTTVSMRLMRRTRTTRRRRTRRTKSDKMQIASLISASHVEITTMFTSA
jgi:hypothetical protein